MPFFSVINYGSVCVHHHFQIFAVCIRTKDALVKLLVFTESRILSYTLMYLFMSTPFSLKDQSSLSSNVYRTFCAIHTTVLLPREGRRFFST